MVETIIKERNFKIFMFGEQNSGKTTFLHRIISGSFYSYYDLHCRGADFFFKECNMDDFTFKVNIWDTAGIERF